MDQARSYLFASVRVVLARGPDGQAIPRDGTSPRRDERCNSGAIVGICAEWLKRPTRLPLLSESRPRSSTLCNHKHFSTPARSMSAHEHAGAAQVWL
jgi:hypothetical protein